MQSEWGSIADCVSRPQRRTTFPADFMMVGAMNPCPCGYYGDTVKPCTCPPGLVARYQRRISGPFLDRVDIFVEVPRIDYEKLATDTLAEASGVVQSRVAVARGRQVERFASNHISCNAGMTPAEIREHCQAAEGTQALLRAAMQQLSLSGRAFHRILKLGRTIADLEGSAIIQEHHIAEAIQYRPRRLA